MNTQLEVKQSEMKKLKEQIENFYETNSLTKYGVAAIASCMIALTILALYRQKRQDHLDATKVKDNGDEAEAGGVKGA